LTYIWHADIVAVTFQGQSSSQEENVARLVGRSTSSDAILLF